MTRADLYRFFRKHQIKFTEFSHPPVFTVEEAQRFIPSLPGLGTKNLFLRNKNGKHHVLLTVEKSKRIHLKRFAQLAGYSNLSMASKERLEKYLGVQPGAVSLFGLINDLEHSVEFYIDEDIWLADAITSHPLQNDKTVVISGNDLRRFLSILKYEAHVCAIPEE